MKNTLAIFLIGVAFFSTSFAQQTIVKGSVLDGITGEPIPDVTITIEETGQTTKTDARGLFSFTKNVPLGEQVLKVEKIGFETKRYPIIVNRGKTVDITGITLDFDDNKIDQFVISISDDNLNSEDDGLTDNISGLLQASKDAFLSAAAYDFSATFFRPRGLDNANGKVLINGIEMNKQFSGRPQWANWGGLNDVQRNQVFSMGISANDYNFGDLAGTNNIIMRASKYREGGRASYASANRSYTSRVMASYGSGLLKGGWSYSVLVSRRYGDEGFIDGTLYDANSLFVAVEKQISEKHSINFTGIYAKNRRGRSTAITEEVFELKGNEYNPFWGHLNGEQRNARMRETNEPILMLNHYWDINSKIKLNSNLAYQFGEIANSRIDNNGSRLVLFNGEKAYLGGARNPTPEYYQNLPSFFLQDPNPTAYDYQQAFLAREDFVNDGQLNWSNLYTGNASVRASGGNSIYIVQSDVIDDKQLSINSILDAELADNIRLNAAINYRHLYSENYARVDDLLGGTGYLDIDSFAEAEDGNIDSQIENLAQSNTLAPDRIAKEGDRYKYNYEMDANVISTFAQAQFKYNKVDFYIGAKAAITNYQRNGLYQNGYFKGSGSFNSLGKSEKLNFTNFGIKGGFTYKVTGKHLIDVNATYFTKAPNIRNSFGNARQSNQVVFGLKSEEIQSADASYIFRSPILKMRLTGFYSRFQEGTDIGFFFSQSSGNNFLQEIQTGIKKRHIGAELGIEAQLTPTIKLKGAASIGQYTYANNPQVYYTYAELGPRSIERLTYGDGTTALKDYHISGGPERAYQIGFEYRDPEYWNIGITTNFFSNAYVDPSALKRTSAFTTDPELLGDDDFRIANDNNGQSINISGNTFNDYNEAIAIRLLEQEQFEDYMLVNIIGGKSWRINKYFVGFFATINNVFNKHYRTGGFEQSRRVDYRSQLEEQTNANGPIFGNRYFYGNGTTYYLNAYIRF